MSEEPMVYTVTEEDTDIIVPVGCAKGTINCVMATYQQLIAYCVAAGSYTASAGTPPVGLCTQWGVYGG
jgi:hypothetical protein